MTARARYGFRLRCDMLLIWKVISLLKRVGYKGYVKQAILYAKNSAWRLKES